MQQEQEAENAEEQEKAVKMREQVLAKQQQQQEQQQQQQQAMQPEPAQSQPVFGQTMPPSPAPVSVSYLPGQQAMLLPGQQPQQRGPAQPSIAQKQARRAAEQERQKWSSPTIFNNYKEFMKQRSAPAIPDQVQKEYHVYEGKNVLCGPVPLRPIRLSQAGDLEACQQKCTELVTCVGFVTDLAQTKCLFRSWDSLQTCKKRYRVIMQDDGKMVTLLKNDLILDGLNN